MNDRVIPLLEEIRDLQREHVQNYREALRNQQESIRIQQQAQAEFRRRFALTIGIVGVLSVIVLFLIARLLPYL